MIATQSNIVLSQFVPTLVFRVDYKEEVTANFINPLVDRFFSSIKQERSNFDEIDYSSMFTDVEFENTSFNIGGESFVKYYLYNQVLKNVSKLDGSIIFRLRYCLTFDKVLTPKSKEGIHYGILKLGEEPILYFIYIDFQEFLSAIKKL